MRVPLDRTQEAGESADIWSSFFFFKQICISKRNNFVKIFEKFEWPTQLTLLSFITWFGTLMRNLVGINLFHSSGWAGWPFGSHRFISRLSGNKNKRATRSVGMWKSSTFGHKFFFLQIKVPPGGLFACPCRGGGGVVQADHHSSGLYFGLCARGSFFELPMLLQFPASRWRRSLERPPSPSSFTCDLFTLRALVIAAVSSACRHMFPPPCLFSTPPSHSGK